jgi:hypothetical protein
MLRVFDLLFFLSLMLFSAFPSIGTTYKAPASVRAQRAHVYNLMVDGRAVCTAFAVEEQKSLKTYVISAGHCTSHGQTKTAFIRDSFTGKQYPVELQHSSFNWPNEDYSLWFFTGEWPKGGIRPTDEVPDLGDDVWTFGGPLGMTPMLSGGVYSGMSGCATPGDEACEIANMHSVTVVATYGSSGSPVLDAHGRVWAILVAGHPRIHGISQVVLLPFKEIKN